MGSTTSSTWHALPLGHRRRLMLSKIVRSTLVSAAVIMAYFLLPISGERGSGSSAWLVGGLVVVGSLLVWQVRDVLRSPYPAVTAVGAVIVSVPLFLLLFASLYYVMGVQDPGSFSEPLTKLDAVYFAVTVFSTVGFGDIHAVSQAARGAATLQMVNGLVLVGVIARILMGAVEENRRRQGRE